MNQWVAIKTKDIHEVASALEVKIKDPEMLELSGALIKKISERGNIFITTTINDHIYLIGDFPIKLMDWLKMLSSRLNKDVYYMGISEKHSFYSWVHFLQGVKERTLIFDQELIENSGTLLPLEIDRINQLPNRYNAKILDIYEDKIELIINEWTAIEIADFWNINFARTYQSDKDKIYGYEVALSNFSQEQYGTILSWLRKKFMLPF